MIWPEEQPDTWWHYDRLSEEEWKAQIPKKELMDQQPKSYRHHAAGIPVWRAGDESRFPGLFYIIFPGNVGDENTLRDVISVLEDNEMAKKRKEQIDWNL